MEQVCYADDERHRALDELDSLVEKGLVRVVGSGERYALLETIRAFAAEQLHAGGEVDAARHAHADYFLAFSAEVAAGIFGTTQLEAMRRGRDENANTQAAIQWLTARAQAGDLAALEKALLLCGQLDWFWHIGAPAPHRARVWLDALLALAADRPPSRGRALAWLAAGMVSTTTGEWERCAARVERRLRRWRGGRRRASRGRGDHGHRATATWRSGAWTEAGAAFDEAIARSTSARVRLHARGSRWRSRGCCSSRPGTVDAGMALGGPGATDPCAAWTITKDAAWRSASSPR